MPQIFSDEQEQVSQIMLGETRDGHGVYMLRPEKDGQQISNTILLTGTTGSGKTNVKKLVAMQMSKRRPVYLMDPPGRDDYLCYTPNKDASFLVPGTRPEALKAVYYYYPMPDCRERQPYEKIVRPNFSKYTIQQFVSLGISAGAAVYIQNVIKRYGPFDSFESFYDFIENFPCTEIQCNTMIKNQEKHNLKHDKFYEMNDKIPTNSKDNLTKILPFLLRLDILRMDDEEEVNY